ncbi:MAG: protein-export chaperone SecB [Gammaproteobacteria bacterium]|nr:MAG: protein-export chaperone SecB [Gammaproteobacteria bacterium]
MANKETNPGTDADDNQQRFHIQKIYVKDMSFETPNSPQIFSEKWKPEVNLEIRNTAKILADDVHEVILALTATVKIDDKVAYLIEVQQAGIFNISGFEKKNLAAMVGSYCPNILFPYARECVSDVVSKGGFPQLVLAPVNFDSLYSQHLQSMQNSDLGQPETSH